MRNKGLMLTGLGLGAAVTYLLDPAAGSRRRAVVRDKAARGVRVTGRALDATARDLANRTRGMAAAAQGRWMVDDVDDARLAGRVRAKLGRACSHARAIDVDVQEGEVTLRGPVLAREVDGLLASVASVRGVITVVNELEPHESAEGVSSLQGEDHVGDRRNLIHRNWYPGNRAIVGVGALAAAGMMIAVWRR